DGDMENGEVDAGIGEELLAQLADEALLGRLEFSNIDGDTDGDGDIDVLHALGARSFSIFDADGSLVFDSSGDFERITSIVTPESFNSNGAPDSFDSRSDDGGPEPEGATTGVIGERTFAFIGLERVGGVMIYDITDPANAVFDRYVRVEGDIGPEGLKFISAEDSPTGLPLLAVSNEVSETLTFLELDSDDIDRAVEETGGEGDDELTGGRGSDDLRGGQGADTLTGGDGDDTLFGGGDGDSVDGGRGDDSIRGQGGEDELKGSAGFDEINGGGGADTIEGGRNADTLVGGDGDDNMSGSGGADEMLGRGGDDFMRGGRGDDDMGGGLGDDRIVGGNGADELRGGQGDDTITGGRGDDVMLGGLGADTFRFVGVTADDRIDDFEQGADLLSFLDAADLADLTLTQDGSDVLIAHAGGSVLLTGRNAADFDEDDFLFG
ncbi:MAG: bifunctional metallophosphatase/5'-nucleotidase, partial [Pseudomonadota bacterium]